MKRKLNKAQTDYFVKTLKSLSPAAKYSLERDLAGFFIISENFRAMALEFQELLSASLDAKADVTIALTAKRKKSSKATKAENENT